MRFLFDAQQRGFAESVRTMLSRECAAATVRAEWEGGPRSRRRWQKLADAGLCGLLVDEGHGGTGSNEVDAVLALEETGRFALPDPLVETALVAAPLLAAVAPTAARERWLHAIAAGQARVAVLLEASGRYCVDADQADLLVLQHGDSIHAVEPAAVSMTLQPSLDAGRGRFSLHWTPSAASELASGPQAVGAVDAGFDRGAFATSAQLLGLATRMIDMAADYARTREQFGRPIGGFQAVKHLLADALLAVEFARPVVYRAAWSLAYDAPDRERDVSMAKAYASEAARAAGRAALQIHGAIGYTWAHDLHIWMKRAESLARDWGTAAWHRERVARSLLAPQAHG
jgi:alkylation response protein AidB-like acyl-CoA dehydrogenase